MFFTGLLNSKCQIITEFSTQDIHQLYINYIVWNKQQILYEVAWEHFHTSLFTSKRIYTPSQQWVNKFNHRLHDFYVQK